MFESAARKSIAGCLKTVSNMLKVHLVIADRQSLELELADEAVAAHLLVRGGAEDAYVEGLVGHFDVDLEEQGTRIDIVGIKLHSHSIMVC